MNHFNRPNRKKIITNENNRNVLFLNGYFKENSKLITIDLVEQQGLDADSKAIPHFRFSGILMKQEIRQLFSSLKNKVSYFGFFTRNYENITNTFHILFCFDIISI